MIKTSKIAAVALAFVVSPLALTGVAQAADIQFQLDNVHIGYHDGYWDRQHTWHTWEREDNREAFRKSRGAEYHDWKHDRDKDMGWHDHR